MRHWKYLRLLIVGIILQLACVLPLAAQTLPDLQPGKIVYDLSESLSADYLRLTETQLARYPFTVRVVYLPQTTGVNLGQYAARLFRHWDLPRDSLLLVVALDRRKMGVHAGSELKTLLAEEPQPEQDLPQPTPVPGVTPDPTLPLDVSSEFDHLELIPQAVDQIADAMRESPDKRQPSGEPLANEDTVQIEQESSPRPRRQQSLDRSTWLLIIAVALLMAVGVGSFYGFRFWRRWHKTRELIDRYSLQGQVVYEQLEAVYADLEAVMPDFHGYLGETEKTLGLFLKSMHTLQSDYETIFDAFDAEIKALGGQRDDREAAIDFFRELELKLEEGKQLHEQAFQVLKNLKDVRQSNQQLFALSDQKRQAFSQELSEMRKLNPLLKLKRIQLVYQQRLQELQRLEKQNERDPLGVEKALKEWRKQLSRLEQETRSLPHLWQQFNQDLKQRIQDLRKRVEKQGSPAQRQALEEIEKLHRTLLQAIQEGDVAQLNRWNERFTQKLQALEAEV